MKHLDISCYTAGFTMKAVHAQKFACNGVAP